MATKRLFLGFLLVLNLFLGYRLMAGETGMFAYLERRGRFERLQEQFDQAQQMSRELSQQIRRLKSDESYVQNMIRARMNYVGEDETLYLFKEQSGEQAATKGAGAGQDDDKN